MLLPTKNAGFCFKLVYVNCIFFFFDEQAVSWNCTTEKESVNQSPTCLNINIMKSTENQCATASNNYQDAIHSETGNNCFIWCYSSYFTF
jgi:hypothetical protein